MSLLFKVGSRLCLLLCLITAVYGCEQPGYDVQTEEIQRVASPDKKYEIVFYEITGGAAVSDACELYFAKAGEKNRNAERLILRVRGGDTVDVAWRDKTSATISIGGKKIDYFTNYATVGDDDIRFYLK